MSAEPSLQPVETDGLRESLAEICASQEELCKFFSGVFVELDALSSKLVRKRQAWSIERAEAESELQRRSAGLEAERAAIAAEREQAWKELDQRRSEVEHERGQVAAAGAEAQGRLLEMLEEAGRERSALQAALEASQKQSESLAQVADELARTRAELAEARQQIGQFRAGPDHAGADRAGAQPDPKLQDRLHAMERELAERDQDRVVLESELDMVRNRAAEMAETLARQQQQMADERQQWTQELKRMRRLLEALSSHGLDHPASVEAPRTRVAPHRPPGKSADEAAAARQGGDPVLGSVMAQFEMLQKDIVRRRKESA